MCTVEGCEVESCGHVSVQVGAGPDLRNKHLRGMIGWGPQGTAPLLTVGDLVPREKPSKPRLGRCGRAWSVVRPIRRAHHPEFIEGKEVPEAQSTRNGEGAIAISPSRTQSKRDLAPHFRTESRFSLVFTLFFGYMNGPANLIY